MLELKNKSLVTKVRNFQEKEQSQTSKGGGGWGLFGGGYNY